MIQIKDLSCKYDQQQIFANLNLDINQDDFLVITGPNGSGKTTLLKAILQQIPYEGSILVDGTPVSSQLKAHKIGYVAQLNHEPICLPISVREYLLLYLTKQEFYQLVKRLDIKDLLNKDVNTLSGGQRQMINIIKTLSSGLNYLILDEPNTGLDFYSRQQLFLLLTKLHQSGIGIIMISHYLDEISCEVNKIFNLDTMKLEVICNEHCQYC